MKPAQSNGRDAGGDTIPGVRGQDLILENRKTPGMMSPPLASLLFAALFLFTACSQHLTEANLKQVRPEMSPKEVESILGQPARVEKFVMEMQRSGPEGIRYFYEQDGKTIVLHFVDGKLISQVPSWNEKKIEQPDK